MGNIVFLGVEAIIISDPWYISLTNDVLYTPHVDKTLQLQQIPLTDTMAKLLLQTYTLQHFLYIHANGL